MKKLLILLAIGLFSMPVIAQKYSIGDVLKGGVVFLVSENKDSVWICGKNDANQYCDWAEAKARCESFFSIDNSQMMKGWRMPTKEEMKQLRERRDVVNKAIEAMNGADMAGRNLKVNEARPREERPPRQDNW